MSVIIEVEIPRGSSIKQLEAAAALCGAEVMMMTTLDEKTLVCTLTVGDHFNINGDWFRIARGTVKCYDDGTIDQPEETIVVDSSEWEAVDDNELGMSQVFESTQRFTGKWV